MKRIISILLTLCMCAALLCVGAISTGAANNVPSGYTPIYTPKDLDAIRKNLKGKYILMNDIDMANWGNWKPIGIDEWLDPKYDDIEFNWLRPSFSGIFDGNNHAIRNLTSVNELSAAGLFAGVKETGVVKNLRLDNVTVQSTGAAGGIAGSVIYGAAVLNCSVSGKVTTAKNEWYGAAAGGIAGNAVARPIIRGCQNAATVTAPSCAGGIIGCSFSGSDMIVPDAIDAEIYRCSNGGTITGARAGGIQGAGATTIINCYNIGTIRGAVVDASLDVYGIGNILHLGGIAGFSYSGGLISGCYNIGKIQVIRSNCKTTKRVGAIAGLYVLYYSESGREFADLTSCYYLIGRPVVGKLEVSIDKTGESLKPICVAVKALNRWQMKQQCSFTGFDFENVWEIKSGRYPTLRADIGDALSDPLPVVPDPFWVDLPNWQQFILRWLCFGWAWMA